MRTIWCSVISVHTNRTAFDAGEAEIQRIGARSSQRRVTVTFFFSSESITLEDLL
jgi:hypothetical protein